MKLQSNDIQSTLSSSLDLIEKCFAENEEKQFKIRDSLRLLESKRLISKRAIDDTFRKLLKIEDDLIRDLNEAIDSKGQALRLSLHNLEVISDAIKEKRDHINNLMKGKINEDLDDNIENIHRSILEISFKANEHNGPVDILEFFRSDKFEKVYQKENIGYIRQLATLPEDMYFVKQGGDILTDVDSLCGLELVCKQDCPELRDHLKCLVEDQERKQVAYTFKHTADGRYVVQFVPLKLGYYTISVTLYGQAVTGSPLLIYATPPARRSGSRYGKATLQNGGGSLMYGTPSFEGNIPNMTTNNGTAYYEAPRRFNRGSMQTMSDYRISKSYTAMDDKMVGVDMMIKDKHLCSSGSASLATSGSSNSSSTTQIISKFKISTEPRITYSKDFLIYCASLPVTQVMKEELKKHRIILKDLCKGVGTNANGVRQGYKEYVGPLEPHVSPSTAAKKHIERMDCGDSCDKAALPCNAINDRDIEHKKKLGSKATNGSKIPTGRVEEQEDDNVIIGAKLRTLLEGKNKQEIPTERAGEYTLSKRHSDENCKRNRSSVTSEIGRPSSAHSVISTNEAVQGSQKKFKYGNSNQDLPMLNRILTADSLDRENATPKAEILPLWTTIPDKTHQGKSAIDLEELDDNVRRLSLAEIFGEIMMPKRPVCPVKLRDMISSNVIRGPGIESDLVLQIGKWGKGILGTFNFPIGITVCPFSNNIIICDSGNDKIKIFDQNGNQEVVIGTSTKERRFTRPSAAVVLDNGNICIKDDFRLQIYTPTGKFVQAFGDGHVNRPYGLGVTRRGWIVTCCYTFPDPTLQFYDSTTGKLAQQSSLYTICGNWRQGSKCRFLAVHDDWIAITDLGKHLVYRVDFDGKPLAIFGGHNNNNHVDLIEPSGVAIDSEGTLAIADSKSDRIHIYDKDGNYICPLRTTKNGSLVSLSKPADMCFGPDGCLYIVNLLGHNTMKFRFIKD